MTSRPAATLTRVSQTNLLPKGKARGGALYLTSGTGKPQGCVKVGFGAHPRKA